MLVRGSYRQDATYWGAPVPDGTGGQSFAAPVPIKCRWEEKAEKFTNVTGDIDVSKSIVYIPQVVQIGGYLLLGLSTATNPLVVAGAEAIRQIMNIPSLRNADNEIRAFL